MAINIIIIFLPLFLASCTIFSPIDAAFTSIYVPLHYSSKRITSHNVQHSIIHHSIKHQSLPTRISTHCRHGTNQKRTNWNCIRFHSSNLQMTPMLVEREKDSLLSHHEKERPSTDVAIRNLRQKLKFSKKGTLLIQHSLSKSDTLVQACCFNIPQLINLQTLLGDTDKLQTMMMKHPNLIASIVLHSSHTIKSTDDILHDTLHLSHSQIQTLRKKYPMLNRLQRSDLRHKLHFFRTALQFTDKNLIKLISTRPQILAYSRSNLNETVQFFIDEWDLSPKELSQMVSTMPLVLTYSIANKLRPTLTFITDEIGCSKNQTKKIAIRYPQVLTHSIDTKLRPKLLFLSDNLRLEHPTDIPRIVSLFPPTLWLTPQTLSTKLHYFQTEFRLSDAELRCLIVTMPQLLGLSVEQNLIPKIEFLKRNFLMNDDDRQLKEFVLYQPALLAYSLEQRIRPRVRRLKEHCISFRYCPMYVMSFSDEKFDLWLEMQVGTWSIRD